MLPQQPVRTISIHAPREGSDFGGFTVFPSPTNFYPRSPRGERLVAKECLDDWHRFLSTLPARGATQTQAIKSGQTSISIHAPREGSDVLIFFVFFAVFVFLSTLPARGATCGTLYSVFSAQ